MGTVDRGPAPGRKSWAKGEIAEEEAPPASDEWTAAQWEAAMAENPAELHTPVTAEDDAKDAPQWEQDLSDTDRAVWEKWQTLSRAEADEIAYRNCLPHDCAADDEAATRGAPSPLPNLQAREADHLIRALPSVQTVRPAERWH